MKKKQIRLKKWLIPIVLFLILLALVTGIYVLDKGNITNSIAQTDINNKATDSQIEEEESLKYFAAKSLIPLVTEQKEELLEVETDIRDVYYSKRENAQDYTKEDNTTLPTILWRISVVLLLSLIIGALILFFGLYKFLKFKKMNQDINNGSYGIEDMGQSIPESENLDETQKQKGVENIEFKLPQISLTYELLPHNNSQSCTVILKCSRTDATIYYCVSPNNKEVCTYTSPFDVFCNCSILAKAQYRNEQSEQITIDIVLPKICTAVVEEEKADVDVDENVVKSVEAPTSSTNQATNTTRVFTTQEGVIGISYQGDNHVKHNPAIPCQDYHSFTKVNNIWSIAIVSDGAGSKEHSDIGSNAVCAAFTFYLSQILKTNKHFKDGNIPQEKIWDLEFRSLLTRFQIDLKSQEPFKSYGFDSLAATIVILAYSPRGYIFAHVGDGRAGVKINGEWQSILTPHKGEEANQTIFSTTIEFIKKPTLMMSGVFVPETKVSNTPIEAFVLMSDGCEDGAWVTYQRVDLPNGDFKVQDVNQPRAQTLDNLIQITDATPNEQKQKLIEFITTYNKGFKNEGDDKTILIGKLK